MPFSSCLLYTSDRELEREKEVIVDEINTYKDSPADLIYDTFEDMLFEGSELGHNILGLSLIHIFHTVTYESEDDVLEIRHTIKNRRTLALGAVVAAEFLCGKQGVLSLIHIWRRTASSTGRV